ncbi:MAG TPA: SDR family oxidoreductase [Methanoregulaceae archaeon]|nr:SDR family oxidoreductase [Methanoregulaceae archaeon]
MKENDYYQEKTCIVTGGNSGIGYALCEELLRRGANVYMAGRDPSKVAAAARALGDHGERLRTLIVDVTKQDQVQRAIEGAAGEAGRLDLLFNNAGIGGTIQYEKATLEDWKTIIDTNVWSVIYGVHAAVPIMLRQGAGHIVNTSSIAGIVPPPMQALYSLTKFGVTGLTECLRYEYAEKGIRFSTICPANIATPIFKKSIDGTVHEQLGIPDDAYPVEKAVNEILDKVAAGAGIIVVPEKPWTSMWRKYWAGDPEIEEFLLKMAHDRRESFETKGTYY